MLEKFEIVLIIFGIIMAVPICYCLIFEPLLYRFWYCKNETRKEQYLQALRRALGYTKVEMPGERIRYQPIPKITWIPAIISVLCWCGVYII